MLELSCVDYLNLSINFLHRLFLSLVLYCFKFFVKAEFFNFNLFLYFILSFFELIFKMLSTLFDEFFEHWSSPRCRRTCHTLTKCFYFIMEPFACLVGLFERFFTNILHLASCFFARFFDFTFYLLQFLLFNNGSLYVVC